MLTPVANAIRAQDKLRTLGQFGLEITQADMNAHQEARDELEKFLSVYHLERAIIKYSNRENQK